MNLLTLDQAATELGVGRTKLGQLINRRHLAVVRLGHRTVRVRPADLAKALEKLTERAR
jgi:excisionase family DNA binding protein